MVGGAWCFSALRHFWDESDNSLLALAYTPRLRNVMGSVAGLLQASHGVDGEFMARAFCSVAALQHECRLISGPCDYVVSNVLGTDQIFEFVMKCSTNSFLTLFPPIRVQSSLSKREAAS
jgi:dTDP-D-glucose 4,6-dehydratase